MAKVKIVEACEDMCKELSIVKRQVWETTYRGIYPDKKLDNYSYAENEEKFKSYINSNNIELYVVMSENKIIGYTAVGKSPYSPGSNDIEIVLLYILKEFQGMGIGKKIFNFAKDKIKNKGKKSFVVCCNKYNLPAQDFYKNMGCKMVKVDEDNFDRSLPQVTFIYNFF